jgi:hypothetical protein
LGVAVVFLSLFTDGCGTDDHLKEIQRKKAGDVDVVLLSRDGLVHQKSDLTVEFRKPSDGELIDVTHVRASATMPMPGMAPMFGTIDIRPSGTAGRFFFQGALEMAGSWRVTFSWEGPGGSDQVTLNATVQ